MLGWTGLIEAEEIALDLPIASSWISATPPSILAGSLESITPGTNQVRGVGITPGDFTTGGGDYLIYDDTPFLTTDFDGVDTFTVSRSVTFTTGLTVYKVSDEATYQEFVDKRASLIKAYHTLLSLKGYNITATTPTSTDLQYAQITAAIEVVDPETAFYTKLINSGVKREKRSDAETEMFQRAGGIVAAVSSDVLVYLNAYVLIKKHGVNFIK